MEEETKYGIIEPETEFPVRKLLRVPHKGSSLTVSYPAFGHDYLRSNIAEMQKSYSHPITGKKASEILKECEDVGVCFDKISNCSETG